MGETLMCFLRENTLLIKLFIILLLSCKTANIDLGSNVSLITSTSSDPRIASPLKALNLNGHFSFHDVSHAARDFGDYHHYLPLAVLHPKTVSDIAFTIKRVFQMGLRSRLTVAARGHGHSLQGQAQAPDGVVINMEALEGREVRIHTGNVPYIDVSGGELWINVLRESLNHGLAPKSWTDYLHLTVGGTLSNAGISGQTFRHGPQINNVYQLEIVTGKGEVVTCSEKRNADLFYGVLGGLGQFGIITRARIALEKAPTMVKWIRVLYSNFSAFTRDQELLVSMEKTFDYIEGFVIINKTGLLSIWRASFNPQDPFQASNFKSEGRTLYCLELTKNFDLQERDVMNKEVQSLLSQLRYISSTLFISEVTYLEFLDRVHESEKKLRSKGLWEVPHPWLNLLIPRAKIHAFARDVFGEILSDNSHGPILIYPLDKSKWDNRTSAVTPDEKIFYLVAILSSAIPSSNSDQLNHPLNLNKKILDYCEKANNGMKQYLPHYTTTKEWQAHFGPQWETFVRRKSAHDPLAILAPMQRIFRRQHSYDMH